MSTPISRRTVSGARISHFAPRPEGEVTLPELDAQHKPELVFGRIDATKIYEQRRERATSHPPKSDDQRS